MVLTGTAVVWRETRPCASHGADPHPLERRRCPGERSKAHVRHVDLNRQQQTENGRAMNTGPRRSPPLRVRSARPLSLLQPPEEVPRGRSRPGPSARRPHLPCPAADAAEAGQVAAARRARGRGRCHSGDCPGAAAGRLAGEAVIPVRADNRADLVLYAITAVVFTAAVAAVIAGIRRRVFR